MVEVFCPLAFDNSSVAPFGWFHDFVLDFSWCVSAQRRDSFPALTTPRLQAGRHSCKHWIISFRCFLVLPPWEPWPDSSLLLYPDSDSAPSLSLSHSLFALLLWIIYSLTHRLVSEALWPEEDSFTGVWHDDNLCVPPLRPGWRHQTVRWVKENSVRFLFNFHFCLKLNSFLLSFSLQE